jgi:hypothetical protein
VAQAEPEVLEQVMKSSQVPTVSTAPARQLPRSVSAVIPLWVAVAVEPMRLTPLDANLAAADQEQARVRMVA